MRFMDQILGSNKAGSKGSTIEYKISKEELCQRLGFDPYKVKFIQYDFKTGILLIKEVS